MRIFSILIFGYLSVQILPAQDVYLGAGLLTSRQTAISLESDSINVEVTNIFNRKYLVPSVELVWKLNASWNLVASATYRKHTISISMWDNRADTCAICPLKKGGGPTFHELRIAGYLRRSILESGTRVSALGGAGFGVTLAKDNNSTDLKYPFDLISDISDGIRRNGFYLIAGAIVEQKRFMFRFTYEFTSVYTSSIDIAGILYPFRSSESAFSYSLMYRLFTHNKQKQMPQGFP